MNSYAFCKSFESEYMRINYWRTWIQHMFWIHLKCCMLKASLREVFKVYGVEAFLLRLPSPYFSLIFHSSCVTHVNLGSLLLKAQMQCSIVRCYRVKGQLCSPFDSNMGGRPVGSGTSLFMSPLTYFRGLIGSSASFSRIFWLVLICKTSLRPKLWPLPESLLRNNQWQACFLNTTPDVLSKRIAHISDPHMWSKAHCRSMHQMRFDFWHSWACGWHCFILMLAECLLETE